MRCVILCAGFATRLQPLTLTVAKHLLTVAGRPVLDYVVQQLAAVGIGRGVLVSNHVFADDFRNWADGSTFPVQLQILDDGTTSNETRLGSVGDLRFGLEEGDIQEDFLVINGDNVFTFALDGVLQTFRGRGNTIVLYDVGSPAEAAKLGVPQCDPTGRVVGFREKPPNPDTTVVSIGIYAYRAEVRALVDRYLAEGHSPDKTGQFVAWLHRQTPVYGHLIRRGEGQWFDIGSHEQYDQANRILTQL
ncbi:MAG: nucleotidyltransferase family protein [Candidatus Anammoximicrobium sp.]|nr:nucleotidyltransferase family protein [Candidatus Anammoximicrobium sp.]